MELDKGSIKIDIREGGLYFFIDYNNSNINQEINHIINNYDIKNVNYLSIKNALENKDECILITNQTETLFENEKILLDISEDRLQLKVKFIKPSLAGKFFEKVDILEILESEGIKYGIDFNEIDNFLENRNYEKEYIFAKGLEPEESKDGFIKFYVDINIKKPFPKVLEDGSLDYKSIKLFETAKKEQILAERIDSIKGKNGIDIFGKEVYSLKPKEITNLPKGVNTEILENGKILVAKENGRIYYKCDKVNILPTLEIENGINSSTGNIYFDGNVSIRGEVLAGFTVEADGDIEVNGSVEGAVLKAGGNIFITRGIQGAKVTTEKDIYVQFIENASIYARGNIIVNYILNSNTKCGGALKTVGKKSCIIGGKTIVGTNAFIKNIGSVMNIKTEIHIGINPKVLDRYNQLLEEIDIKYKEYYNLEKNIKLLSKYNIKELNEEKRKFYFDTVKEKLKIKDKLAKLKEDIKIIIPLFNKRKGKLRVYNTLYGGTKIVANNATLFIKEDLDNCIVKNINGKVDIQQF